MEYNNIKLLTERQYMMTIVTECGKFRYNCLPMGICSSGDIFQASVDDLLGDIEVVKTCIYYILVLSKEIFYNNIEHLRIIFGVLRTAGLRVNAPKFSVGFNGITYLGYSIKQDGIKHDPNNKSIIFFPGRLRNPQCNYTINSVIPKQIPRHYPWL